MKAPHKTPRAARPEELALLAILLDGPRFLNRGPVGRCLKKRWCRRLTDDERLNAAPDVAVTVPVYVLTDAGRALLQPIIRVHDRPGKLRNSPDAERAEPRIRGDIAARPHEARHRPW